MNPYFRVVKVCIWELVSFCQVHSGNVSSVLEFLLIDIYANEVYIFLPFVSARGVNFSICIFFLVNK